MKKGFSLIELLISLIIISIIIAAFAPIMTKKLNKRINVAGSNSIYKDLLLTFGNSRQEGLFECKKTDDNLYTNCIFQIPNGVDILNAVLVGGGGGGAGGISAVKINDSEYTHTENTVKTIDINPFMTNVKIKYLIGAGGGGGAGYAEQTEVKDIIKECPENSLIVSNNNESFCVTKYNLRPADINQYHYTWHRWHATDPVGTIRPLKENEAMSLEIPMNITGLVVGANDFNYSKDYVCWQSDTSSKQCTKHSASDYTGCGRTVCTKLTAIKMCEIFDFGQCNDGNDNFSASCKGKWRLATFQELYNTIRSSYIALNMCSYGSSSINSILSTCNNTYMQGCSSGYSCKLSPSSFWGEDGCIYSNSNNYPSSGSGEGGCNNLQGASSVRCVIKMSNKYYNSFAGGGGAAGAIIQDIEVPSNIIEQAIGGKIHLLRGAGGSYGRTGRNGSDGAMSYIEIRNSANKIIWGYRAYGGAGGYKATSNNVGVATEKNTKCEFYNGTSWVEHACTIDGDWGDAGEAKFGHLSEIAKGGLGGESILTINNYNYGQGGNGGDVSTSENSGNSGKNGIVQISYDTVASGASGSAGSGACASRIEKIPVKRGTNLIVRIGSGGQEGLIASNGAEGKETYIQYLSELKFTVSGGHGGNTGIPAIKTGNSFSEAINGVESQEGVCSMDEDILSEIQKQNVIFRHAGKKGSAGKTDEITKNAMGGVGGLSGFSEIQGVGYTYGGCGGYFNEICLNNDRNGLSAPLYKPQKLYSTENYGTLGSGGGGGGWKYNLNEIEPAGIGGKGLDGFVYLYWKKVD